MHSSILRFKTGVPWWALQLIGVAVAVWAISAVYTLRLNPEVAFFTHANAVKLKWVQHLDAIHTNKYVIFGGSSCTTSIAPRRMLELHGLPAVNMGLGAGMGAKILTRNALQAVRPGD